MILHYITVLPRERYAIIFLLFLGLGTIVTTATCCALHITYRHQLVVYYSYIQLAELLACIELSVATMAVSLPSLRAVLYRKQETRRRQGQGKMSAGGGGADGSRGSKGLKRTGGSSRYTGGGADTESYYDGDYEGGGSAESGMRLGMHGEEEDEGRLVILRRVSYDVESVGLPSPPPPNPKPLLHPQGPMPR